ncbi:hypothetical protein PM082_007577 [Marasmius tenuissimus]|nr:hypothetical protein PM082_007577 [Marasmius tenuissimus]
MVLNSDQYLKKSKSELTPVPSYPNTINTSRNPSSSLVSFSSLPRLSNFSRRQPQRPLSSITQCEEPRIRTPCFVRQHEQYTAFMLLTLTSSIAREPPEDTSIKDIIECADNGGTTMVPNPDQYLKKSKLELAAAPSYPNTINTSRNLSTQPRPPSSPILVDGTLDTNNTGALPNDQYATPTNYSPHATPNSGPPSLPSCIGPDDDLLNLECDDASTSAPPQQLSRLTVTTDAVPKYWKLMITSLPPAAPPCTSSHHPNSLLSQKIEVESPG